MGTWDVRLLSASYCQDGDGVTVELFGKTKDEKSITVLCYGFRPYFYVVDPRSDLEMRMKKDDNVVNVTVDKLFYKGDMHDVLKVTIKYPWTVPDYRNKLKGGGYSVLAADIPFHFRYIYDMNMGSCIRVTGKEIEKNYTTDLIVEMETFENIDSFNPNLKFLSFDIENSVLHDSIFTICFVVSENEKIKKCKSITGSEPDILKNFSDLIREEDPDVITGYNINNYDIKKLIERSEYHKIDRDLKWGRDYGPPRTVNSRFWKVKGRLIVDAWWAAKIAIKPKQETLNAISMQLLGETKLDVDPKHMDEEWSKNRDKVIEYCIKDAELALKILNKVGTVRKSIDLATVSMLPVEDVLISGTSTLVDSLLIRKADKQKIGVPLNGKYTQTEQIEGGYVHTMNPGLYHWVCVLDFKSMYPSLIIEKNICFTTLSNGGEIASPNGIRYVSKEKRIGILPTILEELMQKRDSIKALMRKTQDESERSYLDGLQAAVKVLMNTFYGVFASSFYRFTDKNIGSSITAFARDAIRGIIEEIESEGISVIYSDTDSVFMKSPYGDLDSSVKFGNEMAERFSKEGRTLEFEKILEPLFSHGKKKRYVGKIIWPKREEELLVRGYEIRRSDSFDLQSKLLIKLFDYILEEKNDEALALAKKTVQDTLAGKIPISELVISRTCKGLDAYENPDSMANVQAARKLTDMGYDFIPGMKVSWIVTDSNSTPQKVEPYVGGVEFRGKPDYKYYAKRISQMASRITEVFGWGEEDIMTGRHQSTLFDNIFDGTSKVPKSETTVQTHTCKSKNMKLTDFL
ncbi:MAG: DNA polymerase II [archaeon]|nr:DNA polymerase II [archaeon]